jgi:DNA-binding CsgD family transcriptional regulator
VQGDPRVLLRGRGSECAALDELLRAGRAGESRTLVLRGEAGIGKTVLLEYVAVRGEGCRVVRAAGVESEMELPFAAVHQLSMPILDGLERLPSPQRDALETAFGLSSGRPPDRFFVGLALLSLLSEYAEAQPLVCLVDDAQWLDRSSAQVLSFVARRIHAESVVIVLAERDGDDPSELEGLPELRLQGLSEADATELVTSRMPGPLDESVRDRIIAEARGNPLALLELPRGRSSASLAGGFAIPGGLPLPRRIEASYRHRVERLPTETQQILLVAAADPVGDPSLLWRAVSELGIPSEAAAPAEAGGLLEISSRVAFRHPLLRSAIYGAASPAERRGAHRALAAATDPDIDPDRRAWHRAHATLAPDEDVAAELERSAGRAQARGGLAAAAAFLQHAVALTSDAERRAGRALAAAQASLGAGEFDVARRLLMTAEAGPLNEFGRARVDLLRAQVVYGHQAGGDAPLLLLQAARSLGTLDVRLCRDTYLAAWSAALYAGKWARAGSSLLDVSRAAATAPHPAEPPLPSDLLLDGFALIFTEGRLAAAPVLRRAIAAFASTDVPVEQMVRWGFLATRAANVLWDYNSSVEIGTRAAQLARDSGALDVLNLADNACGQAAAVGGDFASATSFTAEFDAVKEATGSRVAPLARVALAGVRGREAEASPLISAIISEATARGHGAAAQYGYWARSVLMNGLGRYEEALAAAAEASEDTPELFLSMWATSELVEAAARTDNLEIAMAALARLGRQMEGTDTDWALGLYTRSHALLSAGQPAERLYRASIDRLGRTRLRPDLARAHLLYGEWLRREGRRVDARGQLRTAYDMLARIGMVAFAERARRELLATGERVRKRAVETRDQLTPQEAQIVQLAREGLTNPEIGARLFLSARTVEWHLRKVFAKLGVSSRRELRAALPMAGPAALLA